MDKEDHIKYEPESTSQMEKKKMRWAEEGTEKAIDVEEESPATQRHTGKEVLR